MLTMNNRPKTLEEQKAQFFANFEKSRTSPTGHVYALTDTNRATIRAVEAMDAEAFAAFRARLSMKATWKNSEACTLATARESARRSTGEAVAA